MPFIFKYMIFSLVGIVLLAIIAAIYIAIRDKKK